MEFITSYTEILPYGRDGYMAFLDEEGGAEWRGFSLQLGNVRNPDLPGSIGRLENAFRHIVSELDDGSIWIVNHDDKDMKWLPSKKSNLASLRDVFRRHGIEDFYKGCLVLFTKELLTLAEDLISYPYVLHYKNLDISHGKLPVIIKLTGHLTIDLLSTDWILLNKIVQEKFLNNFTLVEYRRQLDG